jgi:acyl-CoA synthetase (NDP forming)
VTITPAEKQQAEAAIDSFIESPNVQAALVNLITSGEVPLEKTIEAIINNAHSNGWAGALISALKGSADAEVTALFAGFPPAVLAALATKAVEGELKTLLG